ncbi:MAG: bifunctional pyr operon transcriptional regulator/uracil phosphoribosyltransferase PyrR [Candidatus Omnitrophica bacterium]|nr:bifunctional pyr operon transcriptional regulator/uracil phosphoribosyltransferase PyrR [Candidatus Omnitrophota bacterium]
MINNFKEPIKILNKEEINTILYRLTEEILNSNHDINKLALIGIQTRGVYLAKRIYNIIKEKRGIEVPLGILDITLYRDDLTTIGTNPIIKATQIDFDINDKIIILVDDVLFTGRTVRAALDEIIDFGRPEKVQLVVLIDRGHRELPIKADFVGKTITTKKSQIVQLFLEEVDGKDEVMVSEIINEESF